VGAGNSSSREIPVVEEEEEEERFRNLVKAGTRVEIRVDTLAFSTSIASLLALPFRNAAALKFRFSANAFLSELTLSGMFSGILNPYCRFPFTMDRCAPEIAIFDNNANMSPSELFDFIVDGMISLIFSLISFLSGMEVKNSIVVAKLPLSDKLENAFLCVCLEN